MIELTDSGISDLRKRITELTSSFKSNTQDMTKLKELDKGFEDPLNSPDKGGHNIEKILDFNFEEEFEKMGGLGFNEKSLSELIPVTGDFSKKMADLESFFKF